MTNADASVTVAIEAADLVAARTAAGLTSATPSPAAGWAELGFHLGRLRASGSAILAFRHALALEPRQAAWLSALGVLHMRAHRTQDAIAAGEAAVSLQPNDPACLDNLALALADAGRFEEAKLCLVRAIGLVPDRAESHLSLAQILLANGEMQPGWLEYEWRNRTGMARDTMPQTSAAAWNGMAMRHGRLVVIGDQGFGDTIQFSRFLPQVAALCPETHFCVSPALLPLLEQVPGPVARHVRWQDIPPHSAFVRLSSLPFLFRTELDTIPSAAGYLQASGSARGRWARQETASDGGFRVGLVWSGRETHPNDMRRSIPLAALRPLADIRGVRFTSLQRPVPEADHPLLEQFGMQDLSSRLQDFDDTAALIETLDLVIAVDTSTAHLAGALGKPCWLLLGQPADWRWLAHGDRSPWYGSITLFRQASPGDWPGTIRAVADALSAHLAATER